MITLEDLRAKAPEIRAIALKYGAENIRVFGSVARGDQLEDSDVDFLVDWDNTKRTFEKLHLQEDLQNLLGEKVDLANSQSLYWFIKDRILAEAMPL